MLNQDSRTKNMGKGIVWGTAYRLLAILLPFVTRTIIIYYLGVEYTGLGSLFNSILQVLSLAELGIGHALVFGMYKPVAEGNVTKINAYMALYKKCYGIIGTIVLAIGILLLPFLPRLVSGDLPDGINLYLLYVIYLGNTVVSYFMFAYKKSILIADQHTDITNIVSMICMVGLQGMQIIVLLLFRSYYMYVIAIPVFTIVDNLVTNYIVIKKYPEIVCEGTLEEQEIKSVKNIVGGMIFQKIGSTVLMSVDTIVISAFLGLRLLGIYNNYYYIISALFGFFSIIVSSAVPSIGNSIQKKSINENYDLFNMFTFGYVWLSIFCTTCLLVLYQPFMLLWVGAENMLDMNMVILLSLYFITWKIVDPVYVYRDATGCWSECRFVPLIAAGVNLMLNITMVQFIGLYGVVISTLIAFFAVYIPFFSYPLFKVYFRSGAKYKKYIGSQAFYLLVCIGVAGITYWICARITLDGWAGLVAKGIACAFVSNLLMAAIFFKNRNFQKMWAFIKGKIKR